MNTEAIRQLADVTLDKYRSSIPRKAFEEFVKDIITGENRATAFRYEASPICRASFPSTLDEDGARCTVEVTVYRLNAVAVTAFLLDGPETLLRHIGLDERDTYDAAGAESAYTTSVTRTVTNNRPPVISGTDGALGSFSTAAPSYEYTVTDADGHQVDVVETLDGVTLRSYTVTLGQTNTLTIGSEAWLKVVNGSHTLKIVATDAKDAMPLPPVCVF